MRVSIFGHSSITKMKKKRNATEQVIQILRKADGEKIVDTALEIPVNPLKARESINTDGRIVQNLSGELTPGVAKLLKLSNIETRKPLF